MNCEKAQEQVNEYINRTMPDGDLEEFISHVKTCPNCFDELETYYIVDITMKYLDDEKEDSYNITKLLENDLDKQYLRIQRKKKLMVVVIALAAFLVVSLTLGSFFW